jgi:hypothetical protein
MEVGYKLIRVAHRVICTEELTLLRSSGTRLRNYNDSVQPPGREPRYTSSSLFQNCYSFLQKWGLSKPSILRLKLSENLHRPVLYVVTKTSAELVTFIPNGGKQPMCYM